MSNQEIMNQAVDDAQRLIKFKEVAAELHRDKARLDWLLEKQMEMDVNCDVLITCSGNFLYTRTEIDAAMAADQAYQKPTEPFDGDPYKDNMERGLSDE